MTLGSSETSSAVVFRALVAEDDTQMRSLVADALRREGFEVDEAEDGGRMLRRVLGADGAPSSRYDLLVSDVRMPSLDGLSLVERLRASGLRTPVILMTAFGDEETRSRAARLGVTLFDKPFKMADLRAAARSLFDGGVARRSA